MSNPDDFGIRVLLSKIADGDEEAFRQLFFRYAPWLNTRLGRLIDGSFEKEDIIQETFLRVWLHRDQLPEIEKWKAWLLKICYNRAFNHLRNQRTRQKAQESIVPVKVQDEMQEFFDLSILNKIIVRAITQLPPQQKKIYIMNRENGLVIGEISERLKLSPQTVKNHLGLAMKSIRAALERSGYQLIVIIMLQVLKHDTIHWYFLFAGVS